MRRWAMATEPGCEGPGRIIAVADPMDGQQHVLHDLFHIGGIAETASHQAPKIRRYSAQKLCVGPSIAVLGPPHEDRPILGRPFREA